MRLPMWHVGSIVDRRTHHMKMKSKWDTLTARLNHPISCFTAPRWWMAELFTACYRDVACASGIPTEEVGKDLQRVFLRLDKEGVPFFTRTLPMLCKELEKVLAADTNAPYDPSFPGFAKEAGTSYPKLFGKLMSKVLDSAGRERSDASPAALAGIRQITGLFYKTRFPSTEEQNNEVIKTFLQNEEELPHPDTKPSKGYSAFGSTAPSGVFSSFAFLTKNARNLIAKVLSVVDPLDPAGLIPRHGPGSVATGEDPHEKPVFKRYYHGLHSVFPFDIFMSYNLTATCDQWRDWQDLESLDEGTAKVVLVPKDSRGPRLISCEPLELQWMQQAQMKLLVDTIEASPLTKGKVNFSRQSVNRVLALRSSVNVGWSCLVPEEEIDPTNPLAGTRMAFLPPLGEDYVTLDMKEASDRVSLFLFRQLFPERWITALEATRSAFTKLPDGRVVWQKKFAPMGSANCFPVEALVFWSLARAVLDVHNQNAGTSLTERPDVFVYGDDIILPRRVYEDVVAVYESVGLKVNKSKCCLGNHFRESCGMDAYKGVPITPLRIREPYDPSFRGTALFSWCAYHNWFARNGYNNAAMLIRGWLRETGVACLDERIWGNVPFAYLHCAGEPDILDPKGNPYRKRFNRLLSRWEYYGWVSAVRTQKFELPGWSELLVRAASVARNDTCSESFGLNANGWTLTPDGDIHRRAKAYQYTRARRVNRNRAWLPLYKR